MTENKRTNSTPVVADDVLNDIAEECAARHMFPSSWIDEIKRDRKTTVEFLRERANALEERDAIRLPFFLPSEKPRLEAFIAGWLLRDRRSSVQ